MDIRKLQRAIVDGLEDVKAQHIVVFNTEHLSPLFERVIIASGTSNRQTKSLASSVRDAVKSSGFPVLRTEGEANGEWIIVDCGAAVVHVMQPSIREYYHLEEIWGDKPVNMKLAAATGKLVKAAEPDAPARAKAAAPKPTHPTGFIQGGLAQDATQSARQEGACPAGRHQGLAGRGAGQESTRLPSVGHACRCSQAACGGQGGGQEGVTFASGQHRQGTGSARGTQAGLGSGDAGGWRQTAGRQASRQDRGQTGGQTRGQEGRCPEDDLPRMRLQRAGRRA